MISQNKVELPLEVYEAFERLKRNWGKLLSQDDMNTIFLNINHIAQMGDALVLKEYAKKNPTKYIQAIANGYVVERHSELTKEVKNMLEDWLNSPFDDEEEDNYSFAKKIIMHVKSRSVNHI